ncbi:hypothetical protein BGX28_005688 [Mortierella sp. GBA30]|nr:hypothetical protein BGX28_005688 [Mortierella sp. GBA30]
MLPSSTSSSYFLSLRERLCLCKSSCHPRRISRQKLTQYIALIIGILVMSFSGSLFSFASFSTDIRLRFTFTSSHINLLSAIGDTSMYVGFLIVGPIYDHQGPKPTMIVASVLTFLGYGGMVLAYERAWGGLGLLMVLYCLAGIASTAAYLAALATNMSNFPASSAGTLSGVLLACFGLSATLFSQIKTNLFTDEDAQIGDGVSGSAKGTRATGQFLMFLTVITTATYVLAAMFMSKVIVDADTGIEDAAAGPEKEINFEGQDNNGYKDRENNPGAHMDKTGERGAGGGEGGGRRQKGLTTVQLHPSTSDTTLHVQCSDVQQSEKVQDHPQDRCQVSSSTTAESKQKFNPFLLSIEMKPRELLTEPTFWLFVLAQVLQQGFSYINNIDSVIHAILDAPDPAVPLTQQHLSSFTTAAAITSARIAKETVILTGLHITLISLGNCLGRLLTGILSDLTLSRYRISRSVFFFVSEILILIPLLLMSFSSPGTVSLKMLIFNSCMIGLTYGSTSALFASMTRDFFGSKYYGTCCGMVMILNGFNPFIANQIYGLFYDRATAAYSRALIAATAAARGESGSIANTAIKVPFLEGESTLAPAVSDQRQDMCMAGASCYEDSFRIATVLQLACMVSAGVLFMVHMRKGHRLAKEHEREEQRNRQKQLSTASDVS